MLEKDYLIRYLNALFEALQKLKNNVETSTSSGDEELKYAYALLGGDFDFFKEMTLEDVIKFFERKNGEHLESIHTLSRILYYDALEQNEEDLKLQILLKSKELNDFYSQHTDAFNFVDVGFGNKVNVAIAEFKNTE
ncbi:hypothetical protein [Joostella sp. CR20]|uniref:hypothetical protein n=1 Tax=Joostella sp. CR20 TaxID=2804312 RepID=UPI00313DABEE